MGRLQLRLGGDSSPAQPKVPQPADITANPTVGVAGMNPGDAGNPGGTGVQRYSTVVNPNLRLS